MRPTPAARILSSQAAHSPISDAMARRFALVPMFLCVLVVAACGSAQTETVSGPARAAARSSLTATPKPVQVATRPKKQRRHVNRVHRAVLTACDANIRVKAATTTCAFAQNVFYEYWKAAQSGPASSIDAYSRAGGRTHADMCGPDPHQLPRRRRQPCHVPARRGRRIPRRSGRRLRVLREARSGRGRRVLCS